MGAIQFSVLSWGYHVKLFKSLGEGGRTTERNSVEWKRYEKGDDGWNLRS